MLPRRIKTLLVNIFSDPKIAEHDELYLCELLRVILQNKMDGPLGCSNKAAIELAVEMARKNAEEINALRTSGHSR